jgi:hypothetical protein
MSKITLEFDGMEEADEAQNALNGSKWKAVVWALDQKLRATTKYGASAISKSDASEIEQEIAEKYRETIREIVQRYSLNLD